MSAGPSLRWMLPTVRPSRYATLSVLMAIGAVSAGIWQMARYDGNLQADEELRA